MNTGYVMEFKGHGAFSPDGKVNMSAEQIESHNQNLMAAKNTSQSPLFSDFYALAKWCQANGWRSYGFNYVYEP